MYNYFSKLQVARSPELRVARDRLLAIVTYKIIPDLVSLLSRTEWIGCEAAGQGLEAANEVWEGGDTARKPHLRLLRAAPCS